MGIADNTWVPARGKEYDWSRSVGVVETLSLRPILPEGGFACESGQKLPELEIAYETYGTLDPDGGNAILVTPPLTAGCHVAGFHASRENVRSKGWWDEMVGPGKAVDTGRWFVVCASMLGGCAGTTGPASVDPATGKPIGSSFPDITIGDMVEVQRLLLDHLRIGSLYAVLGGSMGGMQALEWSLRHPERVRRCVCVAAAPSLSTQALAFDVVERESILNDPGWTQGDYLPSQGPARGLSLARQIAHITYLSAEGMAGKFGRRIREDDTPDRFHTAFEIEKYLDYQGVKFVERFDANSYLHITQAMDRFDLATAYGRTAFPIPSHHPDQDPRERSAALESASRTRLREAFARSRCSYLIVALSSDWLFPASESWQGAEALVELGKPVSFCELASPHGHDGFLLEVDQLDRVLTSFLAPTDSVPKASANPVLPAPTDSAVHGLAGSLEDLDIIASMIRPGSRVLDIGCGDGALISHLIRERGCRGEGLDLDLEAVIPAMAKGISALHGDAVEMLRRIPDGAWDHVVLNQTLQAVANPPEVLREILRVGKEAIVGFPNFAVWHSRFSVLLEGRMPKTPDLPFEWYETPNHHPFTLADFEDYCHKHGIEVREIHFRADTWKGRLLLRAGLRNLGADRAIARIARRA
jgi:homoserine O-acetyltransferase